MFEGFSLATKMKPGAYLKYPLACILLGKILSEMERYETSIYFFLQCMEKSRSIYMTSLSLRFMSDSSKELKLFVVALRSLNIARELCTLYEKTITPNFVHKIYPMKRKEIKMKLKKMTCSYCGIKGKLLCCTACMSALYCSKSCQKRDWKLHRNTCDKD